MKKTFKTMHLTEQLRKDIEQKHSVVIAYFYDCSLCDEEVMFDLRFLRYEVQSIRSEWQMVEEISLEKKTKIDQNDKDWLCAFLSDDEAIITTDDNSIRGILYAIGKLNKNKIYSLYDLASEIININDKYESQLKALSQIITQPSADTEYEIEKTKNNMAFLFEQYFNSCARQKEENCNSNSVNVLSVKPTHTNKTNNYLRIFTDGIICYFRMDYGYFFTYDDNIDLENISKQCFRICGVENETDLADLFYNNHNLIFEENGE